MLRRAAALAGALLVTLTAACQSGTLTPSRTPSTRMSLYRPLANNRRTLAVTLAGSNSSPAFCASKPGSGSFAPNVTPSNSTDPTRSPFHAVRLAVAPAVVVAVEFAVVVEFAVAVEFAVGFALCPELNPAHARTRTPASRRTHQPPPPTSALLPPASTRMRNKSSPLSSLSPPRIASTHLDANRAEASPHEESPAIPYTTKNDAFKRVCNRVLTSLDGR